MRNSFRFQCLFVLILALSLGVCFNLFMPQGIGWLPPEISSPLYETIGPGEARKLWESGAAFVDARDAGHYKVEHVKKALNLPPEEWKRMWPFFAKMVKAAPAVVVYGGYFSRAPEAKVAQLMRRDGLPKVYVLKAGYTELKQAGYPVRERIKKKKSS